MSRRPGLPVLGVLVALLLLVTCGLPRSAAAQAPADRAEARALFAAGQAAVDSGRWTDALDAFRRAYELTHAPSALFNAAFALRALGRYREAETAFVELLALSSTRRAMRTEATGYLTEVRGRIAHLSLTGLPDEVTTVRLDAVGVTDDGARPLVLATDPGHHTVEVGLDGRDPFEWSGELADGQTIDLAVVLPTRVVVAVASPVDEDEHAAGADAPASGGGSVVEEAWFWVVIGVVVLGAAGGVAGGLIADDQAQLRPTSGMTVRL